MQNTPPKTASKVQEVLRDRFGLEDFRAGQLQVIEALLAGRSSAAVFPTGGGKSLCYQLPALLMPGVTVVVSPLIALMKDQIDALQARGISAARLDSSLDFEGYKRVVASVRSASLDLLYVAPERFNNERFRGLLRESDITLLAIDEAHCISEWGHNFRPDYLKLAGYAADFGIRQVLALTATATDQVLADICRSFQIAADDTVRTSFYRSNLTLQLSIANEAERAATLKEEIQERAGAAVVYVTLQRTTEELAKQLASQGVPARAYHAGMKPEARAAVQEWFMASSDGVVVATIAFGMGIDKADLRSVFHYNPPKSLENYAQEIGRAGRDGAPARCILTLCGADLNDIENFCFGDTPSATSISLLIDTLFDGVEEGFEHLLNLYSLSTETDIRPLVLKTLLTRLELEGFLRVGTPEYSEHSFKPLVSSQVMLARFSPDRQQFVRGILSSVTQRRVWFEVDLERAQARTGGDRFRVLAALEHLQEQGLIELRSKQVRHRYRVLRVPDDQGAIAATLHQDSLSREAAEMARLGQVIALAVSHVCQSSVLGAHFGQPLPAPCGHCSACLGTGTPGRAPERSTSALPEGIPAELLRVAGLGSPRSLARFLCGLTSPKLTRSKLRKHPLFGTRSAFRFSEVLRSVEVALGEPGPPLA